MKRIEERSPRDAIADGLWAAGECPHGEDTQAECTACVAMGGGIGKDSEP